MEQKKLPRKYRDYLFIKNLRYTFTIIIILYLIFLIFISINSCTYILSSSKSKETAIRNFLSSVYGDYERQIITLAYTDNIRKALNGDTDALNEANTTLYKFCNSQSIRCNFLLLDPALHPVSTNLYKDNLETFMDSQLLTKIRLTLEDSPDHFYVTVNHLYYDNYQTGSMLFAKEIPSAPDCLGGILILDLRYSDLYDYIWQYDFSRVVVTDKYNNIILDTQYTTAPSDKIFASTKYYASTQSLLYSFFHGLDYYISRSATPEGNLQLFTHSSLIFQKQLLTYGTCFIVLLLAISSLIIFRISSSFTNRNLLAIDELVEAAKHIGQGDLDYQLTEQTFDEFQILNSALNRLAIDLKQMNRKNEELNHHKQMLEIKQLKSQFNPHFVFNTLESIRYSIILKPESAANMILSLSKLLRYNIEQGNGETELKAELDLLEDYLSIQQKRFGPCLEYSLNVKDSLLPYRLPKYLLQPIVENCVNHGMRHKKSIHICIRGIESHDCVELSVTDNGNGMTRETLSSLRTSFQDEKPSTIHFGLYSVCRTIRLIYGDSYGLFIDSTPSEGTCVTLKLPPVSNDD
ncbi:MAG: histidine kinase [Lachnospiraceae bacterium]|jgi:two-component system sensor histidine kinase YesM|nr:histidine kinase [Lachnospiraceae bacterium]